MIGFNIYSYILLERHNWYGVHGGDWGWESMEQDVSQEVIVKSTSKSNSVMDQIENPQSFKEQSENNYDNAKLINFAKHVFIEIKLEYLSYIRLSCSWP